MSDREDELETLRAQNARLNEQVRQLVRTERELFLARRAGDAQLRRVRALNQYSLAASAASDPESILRLALELLFDLFAVEQGAAFVVKRGALRVASVLAVEGLEGESAARSEWPGPLDTQACAVPRTACVVGAASAADASRPCAPLIAAVDALFATVEERAADSVVALIPLWHRTRELEGVLVVRTHARPRALSEGIPTEDDQELLDLIGKQVAAALADAALVDDLRKSYLHLARAQSGLVEKERLAAVGELSAQMAHELRNPIGAVFNSVSHLRRLLRPTGEPALLLDIVHEEAERLARIVDDLLDFARPRAPLLGQERVDVVLDGAVALARRAQALGQAEIVVRAPEDLPVVSVDARMMQQALVNLFTNAAQAMGGRGEVIAEATLEDDPLGRWLRIDVTDTGPGIPEELRDKLLQPFFTTKPTGTGLGLPVVRRFVEAHGGELTFRSVPGEATTFTVRVPADPRDPESDEVSVPPPPRME